MKKISLYAGLVLSLASCNFTFDVESPLTEPLLSFEYIAGLHDEQSTWYGQFMIEKLVPVGAEVSPKNDYEIKQLHFTADGRELSWEREMNEVTGEYFSTFRAEIPSEPGTKLEVSVEAEGVAAVRASTTVPASPLFTCTPVQKRVFGESGELTEYIFEVKVSDYKEDDHLAIMLSWFDGYWWINADISGLGDDYSILNPDPYVQLSWNAIYIESVDESEIMDGSFRFKTVIESDKRQLRMRLYRLSPEAYKFLYTSYAKLNNSLGEFNLAPPVFVYSNVESGCGVLGSAAWSECMLDL